MALLNVVQRQALGYWWNLITDALLQGNTVTQIMETANMIAHDQGRSLSFAENGAISMLAGYAKRMDNSAIAFQQADASMGITPDMIATAPYARDETERLASPVYHVKFYYTYIDQSGIQRTDIKTSAHSMRLGATVGEVTASVLDDAEAFSAKYNHKLLSAIPFMIVEV